MTVCPRSRFLRDSCAPAWSPRTQATAKQLWPRVLSGLSQAGSGGLLGLRGWASHPFGWQQAPLLGLAFPVGHDFWEVSETLFFFFFKCSFTEVEFTCHTLHPFKSTRTVKRFLVYSRMCATSPSQLWNVAPSQTELHVPDCHVLIFLSLPSPNLPLLIDLLCLRTRLLGYAYQWTHTRRGLS